MTTHQPALRTYFIVYALLMVGLIATVGIAYLPHGWWSLPGAMAIAFAKATLVVLIFMHVYYSPKLTWIAVLSGLVWLGILLALTLSDYVSRDWVPVQAGWTELVQPTDLDSEPMPGPAPADELTPQHGDVDH